MTSPTPLSLSNREARWLWLDSVGLAETPIGRLDLAGLVERLGFVQLDSIQNVTRAHHHILWSRNQHYREPMLDDLLGVQRGVFEHFSHDACVLPMSSYPWWRRQFSRNEARVRQSTGYHSVPTAAELERILERVTSEGALSTSAFESSGHVKSMWTRPSHKRGLDYLWHAGVLATAYRRNFTKFYDLAERVIPQQMRDEVRTDEEQIDWLCRAALERLVFASAGDLQRFWDAVSLQEARDWLLANTHGHDLASGGQPVIRVCTAQGEQRELAAVPGLQGRIAGLTPPTSRLRIINPFDPAVRDRNRLRWLFGFDYTNEIFVPAAKRRWGYYVYPLLEGDRFVGRLEVRANRQADVLEVCRLWHERGVRWPSSRLDRLMAELLRLARMIGVGKVQWRCASRAQSPP